MDNTANTPLLGDEVHKGDKVLCDKVHIGDDIHNDNEHKEVGVAAVIMTICFIWMYTIEPDTQYKEVVIVVGIMSGGILVILVIVKIFKTILRLCECVCDHSLADGNSLLSSRRK